jgi:hypothetical protein
MVNTNDPFFERVVEIADAISKFTKDTKQSIVAHSVTDPANRRFLMQKPMTALLRNLERIRLSPASGNSHTMSELDMLDAALASFRTELSKLT